LQDGDLEKFFASPYLERLLGLEPLADNRKSGRLAATQEAAQLRSDLQRNR
jgi:hypothetical protein